MDLSNVEHRSLAIIGAGPADELGMQKAERELAVTL
jgi:hypothetical protein